LAQDVDVNSVQSVASNINIKRDDFKKQTTYVGPNATGNYAHQVFLRAWNHDADGSNTYQIYIIDEYFGDWRFYDEAYDSNGNQLDVVAIHKETEPKTSKYIAPAKTEHLGINITKDYLARNQENGIRFKINGRGEEEVFNISSNYIKGFISIIPEEASNKSNDKIRVSQDLFNRCLYASHAISSRALTDKDKDKKMVTVLKAVFPITAGYAEYAKKHSMKITDKDGKIKEWGNMIIKNSPKDLLKFVFDKCEDENLDVYPFIQAARASLK
jgi:hypothetical protein